MKQTLRNCLSLNKFALTVVGVVIFCALGRSQVINYINNGGFEELVTSTATPLFYHAKYWGSTDTLKYYGEPLSAVTVPIKAPKYFSNYQWPRSGNNDLGTTPYCVTCPSIKRGYPRNRLKKTLKQNITYCFTMYVNLTNNSSYAIDAIGAYFGDSSLDTITKCTIPLTYINPQVQNPTNNIISDTLNWILIRGQFVASGNEKYALIGNFKSNAAFDTFFVNPTNSPAIFADYNIDDVSLIELDLPAFAGRDTVIFAGDSLFLGREPDIGIDEACTWYKLPGASPIDTIAGFWIKPSQACSYVVKQEICGLVKWDTVHIYMDAVGIEKIKLLNEALNVYPVPADDYFVLTTADSQRVKGLEEFDHLVISNQLGQVMRDEKIDFKNVQVQVKIEDLPGGLYFVSLSNNKRESLVKKLVVSR